MEVSKGSRETLEIKYCSWFSMQNEGKIRTFFKIRRIYHSQTFFKGILKANGIDSRWKDTGRNKKKEHKNDTWLNLNDYWLYKRIVTMVGLSSNSKSTGCREQDRTSGTLKKDGKGRSQDNSYPGRRKQLDLDNVAHVQAHNEDFAIISLLLWGENA